MVSKGKMLLRNWGGSFECTPSHLFAPTTVVECCAIVELARRIGGVEVRAMGRSHSPGDIVFTGDWIIAMHGVRGLMGIDASQPCITVLAGTFVSDMHAMLEASTPPLAMLNVGSISEQTIGGLISTATHGTGIKQPVISAAVRSMRVVCPLSTERGGTQVLTCSRTENTALFNATLCGLGATGLIVEVTLEVDHLFKLKQVSEECPFDFLFGSRTNMPGVWAPTIGTRHAGSFPRSEARQSIGKLIAHGHRLAPAMDRYMPTTCSSDASLIYPVPLDAVVGRDSDEEDDQETRAAQGRLEAIAASSQFVRLAWFPTVGVCSVMRADRTLEPFQTPSMLAKWHHQIVGYRLTELLLYLSRFHSSLPPRINRVIHYLTASSPPGKEQRAASGPVGAAMPPSSDDHLANLDAFGSGSTFQPLVQAPSARTPEPLDRSHAMTTLVDTSHRVFNIDCLFMQYTNEWAIPLEHAASAIRAMRDWLEEEERLSDGERVHFPVEIRFADGDGIWMSHCQGRRTCFIGLTKYRPYDRPVRYRRLFSRFEMLMRHYAGRPHWAKAHTCGPVEMHRLYPHMHDYLHLLADVDPKGVFRNPYIRRHLLGHLGEDASPRRWKSRL